MLTTREVATLWGITPRRVLQIAKSRGIKPQAVLGGVKVWRAEDITRFEPRPPGRPRADFRTAQTHVDATVRKSLAKKYGKTVESHGHVADDMGVTPDRKIQSSEASA